MEENGEFLIDIISSIREGNIPTVKNWIAEYTAVDSDSKAIKRKEVFGESSWGGNMSGLIWAIDIPEQQVAREMSSLLLDAFPDLISTVDSVKSSPLHYASLNGDSNMIQLLFSKGTEILLDDNEENALHSATLNGHVDATKLLLKKGVNPNQQNVDGCTPLHHAVLNNKLKVVSLLTLHPKINLGLKNNAGQTALDIALTKKNNKDLCALFEQEKNDNLEEIFELEDEISQLQQRISYINSLNEVKKNETHAIYKKLGEIEALHDDAKRQEEQLCLSSPISKKANHYENLINETKGEMEREDQLTLLLQQKLQNNTTILQSTDSQNEESLQNLYANLVSTVKLFEAIKLGLSDAIQPIDSLCKLIKPDHTKAAFEFKKESNEMDIINEENQPSKPKIAGFLI